MHSIGLRKFHIPNKIFTIFTRERVVTTKKVKKQRSRKGGCTSSCHTRHIWLLGVQQVSTMGSRLSSVPTPVGFAGEDTYNSSHVLRVWFSRDKKRQNPKKQLQFSEECAAAGEGEEEGARTKTGQGGILRSRPSSRSSGSSSDPITRIVLT